MARAKRGKKTVSVFVDTNIFLHFRPIDELDWQEIASAEAIEVVVCVQVVRELGQKEYDKRLADRARNAIRMIEDNDGQQIRKGTTLVVSALDPALDDVTGDHRIIAAVTEYFNGNLDRLLVLTDDAEMRILCKTKGIRTVEPDAKYAFPFSSEADELRREIAELRNRHPKLSVALADGPELEVPVDFAPIDVQAALKGGKEDWNTEIGEGLSIRLGNPWNGQLYSMYQYQQDLKWCAQERMTWFEKTGCVYEFEIHVGNDGTAEATNVRLWISFPSGTSVAGSQEIKAPPRLKSPREAANAAGASVPSFAGVRLKPKSNVPEYVKIISAQESEDGRCLIEATFDRITHTMRGTTGPLCLVIPFCEDVHPFDANYQIICSEMPRRVSGQLTFKLKMPIDAADLWFDARAKR